MTQQAQTPHSRGAVQQLAEIGAGSGGRAAIVVGEGPPYYAGLRRGGAPTLLEAVLTLLGPDRYGEITLATGSGGHLPDLRVSDTERSGRQRLVWLFKGGQQEETPDNAADAEDSLIGHIPAAQSNKSRDRTVLRAHLRTWPEQMADLLRYITRSFATPGLRRLIVIDDQFLQPRTLRNNVGNLTDAPVGSKGEEIRRDFASLPSQCRTGNADIILICRTEGHARALTAEDGGAIAYELQRGETDEHALRGAKQIAGHFPQLIWPGAPILRLGTLDAAQWSKGWLPGADPMQPLYGNLRVSVPAAKLDPLSALNRFIGMEAVREKLSDLQYLLQVNEEQRRRDGTSEALGLHVLLFGQPGTGKTEVAKAIAHIYRELGILTGPFVHCAGRADLVAGYIGQTAPKTRAKLEEARGGVLFIDEAYLLAQGGETDFGQEAIGELLSAMTERKREIAVIAAGYPEEMEKFLDANKGLSRRFNHRFSMPEYTDEQLTEILAMHATRSGKSLAAAARPVIRDKIAAHRQNCAVSGRSFGFAGDAVNLLEQARLAQARRFRGRALAQIGNEEFKLLTVEDFRAAQL